MLPTSLAGSYQQYKQDTTVFTTWLSKAAIACGYEIPSEHLQKPTPTAQTKAQTPSKRLKGKARKEAAEIPKVETGKPDTRPIIRYVVPTKELIKQAEVVAKQGKRVLPQGLRRVANRAIDARRRCADWFRTSKVKNEHSDEGHQHFIGTLEAALAILEQSEQPMKGKTVVDTTIPNPDEPSWSQLSNKFQHLQVEDLSEDDDDTSVFTDSGDAVRAVFELEEESIEMKMSLMIFSIFEDLHRIQDFLNELWGKYKADEIDLLSVSLITNTAIQLVRQNEEEILASAPNLFNKKRSYNTIAIVIFYANAFSEGYDPAEKMRSNDSLKPTPFDDFIYLSTARILMKMDFFSKMPDNIAYPAPIWPLRMSFISRPELLAMPYIKHKEKEDVILSQHIIDHDMYEQVCEAIRTFGSDDISVPPAEDEITKSIREVKYKDIFSVASVFACRIFLDIVNILGDDIKKGRQQLKKISSKIDAAIKSTGIFADDATLPVAWLTKDSEIPQRLHKTCKTWTQITPLAMMKRQKLKELPPGWDKPVTYDVGITEARDEVEPSTYTKEQQESAKKSTMRGVELPKNPKFTSITSEVLSVPYNLQDASRYFDSDEIDPAMSDIIRTRLLAAAGLNDDAVSAEHQATAKRLNIKPISPNRDVNLFFTHNPTYCGSVALQLAADSEESGLRLANYHVVPTLIAHLYSETQRTRLLDAAWPEIDQFIGMHIADIFNGQRPQSAAEAFIKYTKTLGISTTTRLNRHQRENPFKEPNYSLLPVSDALRPYFEGKDTFAASVSKLEAVVQAHRQMITHTSKHKRRETRRKLTPIQFLGKMQHLLRRDTEASYRLHKSDQDLLPVDEANTFRDQDKCWNRLPSLQWRRYS